MQVLSKRTLFSLFRSLLGITAVMATLSFASTPVHAQTGGRSVSRTYQGDSKPTFENTFHDGDQPNAGDTGGFGGWDPTSPPTRKWYYPGDGSMYVDDYGTLWRYDEWLGGHGSVWYRDKYGFWHYWGTWDTVGTFSAQPPSDGATAAAPARRELGTAAKLERDERTTIAA